MANRDGPSAPPPDDNNNDKKPNLALKPNVAAAPPVQGLLPEVTAEPSSLASLSTHTDTLSSAKLPQWVPPKVQKTLNVDEIMNVEKTQSIETKTPNATAAAESSSLACESSEEANVEERNDNDFYPIDAEALALENDNNVIHREGSPMFTERDNNQLDINGALNFVGRSSSTETAISDDDLLKNEEGYYLTHLVRYRAYDLWRYNQKYLVQQITAEGKNAATELSRIWQNLPDHERETWKQRGLNLKKINIELELAENARNLMGSRKH